MSISKDFSEVKQQPILQSDWISFGTTRSKFINEFADETLKKQLAHSDLPESLLLLKQQFTEIQIGSEYFFQAMNFLCQGKENTIKENELKSISFHVLLSGFLLMRRAVNSGSTCMPWTELRTQISKMLINSGFSEKLFFHENWKKWLLTISSNGEQSKHQSTEQPVIIENNSLLYFDKFWKREIQLMSLLSNRLNMNLNIIERPVIENVLKNVLEVNPVLFRGKPLVLAEEQKEAVLQAITSPLSIVTGGPGTGKTSVALTILRVHKILGLAERPALVAPTGRAANRMSESVINGLNSIKDLNKLKHDTELLKFAADAKTLHRLLGYHPNRHSFRHHEYDPLEHDLLIIDEGSMIDQELMVRLLRASNSKLPYLLPVQRIVILGDSQQLPSVGNGAVLMELTEDSGQSGADSYENPVPVVKLVKNYRQKINDTAGRNILGVASIVNEMGIDTCPELLFEAESPDSEAILRLKSLEDAVMENVMFLNQENNFNQLKDFGQWWYDKFLKDEKFIQLAQKGYYFEVPESIENDLDYLFNYLKRFRILTATQVFSTGAKALNKIIRYLWLMENEANLLNSEHFPGEPVIVTENNYRLRLFNGDQGIFLNCLNSETKKLELKAVFEVEGKVKTFYGHQLHHLQPAYATTVHKSQGSEFDHLALILPELSIDPIIGKPEPGRMRNIMSREMLYTALTRAKKSVLILGKKAVLETAAVQKEKRYSGLRSLRRSKNHN